MSIPSLRVPEQRRPCSERRVVPPCELDVATREELALRVDEALSPAVPGDRLVVDFSGVVFCDSTAVTALLAAKDRASRAGCAFEVRAPHRTLKRVSVLLGANAALGL